jgi:hypothetical protein
MTEIRKICLMPNRLASQPVNGIMIPAQTMYEVRAICATHQYERGYLGQFVCVKSVDRTVGRRFEQEAAALASVQRKHLRVS